MKRTHRLISLILILALLSGLFVTASAEGEDFTLAVYKDGVELGENDSIYVGDTITVKMTAGKDIAFNSAKFYTWFNPTAFTFEKSSSVIDIGSKFESKSLNIPAGAYTGITDEEQTMLDAGYSSVWLTLNAADVDDDGSVDDVSIEAGTVLASMVFTANEPISAGQFAVNVHQMLHTVDGEDMVVFTGLTGGITAITVKEQVVPVTGISLDRDTLTLTANGDTATLVATVSPANATEKTVTWSSSNETVATVFDGTVMPLTEGTATITAESGGFTATCTVTVLSAGVIPMQSITITDGTSPVTEVVLGTANAGSIKKTITLQAVVSPENATDAQVTWSSSDTAVATVTTAGKVTAKKVGTAVITASTGDMEATCTVTVIQPVTKIEVTPSTFTGRAGGTVQLSATVTPANASNSDYYWESSNTDVATVDNDGLVTIVGPGSAEISAKAKDGSNKLGKCTLTAVTVPTVGYTVQLPEEEEVSTVDEVVSVPVTIGYKGEQDYTTFNTVDIALAYDENVLELVSADLGEKLTAGNGKIHIIDYGADKALGTAFILKFRVKTLTESTVSVDYARIDYYENAATQDIAEAEIIQGNTLIKVAVFYSVELPEGMTSEQGTSVKAGESYSFEIGAYDSNYDYFFEVTMGGETVDPTDNKDGSYTIADVTGDIVVGKVTKTGKQYAVNITGEDTTGDNTANYGADYTFTVDNQPGYTYDVTVTVDGEQVEYTGPDDEGKYTISGEKITGAIEISVVKTVVSELWHEVTFTGSGKDTVIDPVLTALEGANYTFRLEKKDGYSYTVKYAVAGSSDKELNANDDGSYTIPGNEITGDILVTVEEKQVFTVTFTGNGGEHASNPATTVEQGASYTFRVKQFEVYGYTVTVTADGVTETLSGTPGTHSSTSTPWTYEVPNVQSDLTIEITWSVTEDRVAVFIEPFVEIDGDTIYFIGVVPTAYIDTGIIVNVYDGHSMTVAKKYAETFAEKLNITDSAKISKMSPYATLILVEKGQTAPTEAEVRSVLRYETQNSAPEYLTPRPFAGDSLTANGGVLDVNGSKLIDINDAQLIYDIYNGKYGEFSDTMTIAKFLRADTNNDMCVNASDAVVIVNTIS